MIWIGMITGIMPCDFCAHETYARHESKTVGQFLKGIDNSISQ